MKATFPQLAVGLLFGCLPLLSAQQLEPQQAQDILRQLEELQVQREEMMKKGVAGALQRIRAAAASDSAARDFWEEAILQTQFAGQNRENTQLRDWKKEREEALKGSNLPTAVRLHLNYLALTLERASGKTNEELLPALMGHAGLVQEFEEILAAGENRKQREVIDPLLRRSVVDGVFSEWMRLKDHVGKVEGWEMVAGNADGIYTQSVLPLLREKKDPQLLQYWDARIEKEVAKVEETGRTFDAEKLSAIALPRLRWQRVQDELLIGRTTSAVSGMLALLKANPGHPDAEKWIDQLRRIVKETLSPPAASETGTPTPPSPGTPAS